MKGSLITAVTIAAAVVAVPASLACLLMVAAGARPTELEMITWLAALTAFAVRLIQVGTALYGRQSSLETWHSALRARTEQLDAADRELREREWAMTWAKGAPKAETTSWRAAP